MTFDLRSDFLGPPPAAMLEAMAAAAAQPDGFELRENSHQRALEAYAANLLGKPDALLFPTCTMANLVAVMAQSRPGETIIGDAESHCLTSETGGIAAIAGAMPRGLAGHNGQLPLDQLRALLEASPDPQRMPARLVLLETTHNRSGGLPLPLDHIGQVSDLAHRSGAALHIDGARFFNAALALGVSPADMAAPATTISLSLNKGLCAPNGALLVGPRDIIARALILRQQLGGGIRPAGAIAAAGLVALETMLPQLQRDHDNARALIAALGELGLAAGPAALSTNIVLVDLGLSRAGVDAFLAALATQQVLAIAFGPGRIRLCLHRGIHASAIPAIAAAFQVALTASGVLKQEK
ncbi:MAG: low specificity L-threonine aldolase [Hyphomicrobiales bacterium]|nr:MAG: low specificity L-threonine aldolase [Hyphomicrobiales bacterium]